MILGKNICLIHNRIFLDIKFTQKIQYIQYMSGMIELWWVCTKRSMLTSINRIFSFKHHASLFFLFFLYFITSRIIKAYDLFHCCMILIFMFIIYIDIDIFRGHFSIKLLEICRRKKGLWKKINTIYVLLAKILNCLTLSASISVEIISFFRWSEFQEEFGYCSK